MRKVAVIMGSTSDLPVAEKAIQTLKEYGIETEVRVLSAHRRPNEAREFAASARESGFSCIIALAGMAAHLAGAMAANTTLPVIGVPCSGAKLDGMDALLSTVQMPSGIPVATVAIDGAKNAAILAIQIMAVSDEGLAHKLQAARDEGTAAVLKADVYKRQAVILRSRPRANSSGRPGGSIWIQTKTGGRSKTAAAASIARWSLTRATAKRTPSRHASRTSVHSAHRRGRRPSTTTTASARRISTSRARSTPAATDK